ncbi:MAG TPA: prepilin-type N-terminal cleavage/methylation domain-containing protein [Pyrinomonadaceae bacterium]
MKRPRMNHSGFTLIETAIAMLVMMIVGLSATSLFLYSVRYNSGASQRSVAMAVAQQRLEVLRGVDYYDAGLAFGIQPAQTVVIAPTTTTSTSTQGGSFDGVQPYDAPVTASSSAGASNPKVNPYARPTPRPTATPTPTPGGGTGGGDTLPPAGSNTYQIQTQVVAFPIGVSEADATQKQITIRVVPVNGNGGDAWANQSPVEIVFRRSINTPGPYKQ